MFVQSLTLKRLLELSKAALTILHFYFCDYFLTFLHFFRRVLVPAGGPHVCPPALLLCGDNLRSLLHDRHCLLVLLLAGPQSGKCSPLIGWRGNVLLLIGERNTICVPCSMTVTVSWFFFWLDHTAVFALLSLAGGESCFSLVRGTQYVLCSMTVTVSWFSFWLDHKAVSSCLSLAGGAISCFLLARGTQSTCPAP